MCAKVSKSSSFDRSTCSATLAEEISSASNVEPPWHHSPKPFPQPRGLMELAQQVAHPAEEAERGAAAGPAVAAPQLRHRQPGAAALRRDLRRAREAPQHQSLPPALAEPYLDPKAAVLGPKHIQKPTFWTSKAAFCA